MAKNNIKETSVAHQLIKGDGSKLANNIAKKSWSGSLTNHDWYDGKFLTEKGGLQAHHLIPTNILSGRLWEMWRKAYEYDINRATNGLMLPSNTEIACQVETHVHKSNHNRGLDYDSIVSKYWSEGSIEEIPDSECEKLYSEELTYIKGVKVLLRDIKVRASKKHYCKPSNKEDFTDDLDDVSDDILDKLNSFNWTISRYGKDYSPYSRIGCAGGAVESDKKSREPCPHRLASTGLKHQNKNKKGKIMKPRKLKVGR
ncbi:AHH domain-containing protein [Vibrio maritimus]